MDSKVAGYRFARSLCKLSRKQTCFDVTGLMIDNPKLVDFDARIVGIANLWERPDGWLIEHDILES